MRISKTDTLLSFKVCKLLRNSLSWQSPELNYKQISRVTGCYQALFLIVAYTHHPLSRVRNGKFLRLNTKFGLEAFGRFIKSPWCYAVYTDSAAQIHGTASFFVRFRLRDIENDSF